MRPAVDFQDGAVRIGSVPRNADARQRPALQAGATADGTLRMRRRATVRRLAFPVELVQLRLVGFE